MYDYRVTSVFVHPFPHKLLVAAGDKEGYMIAKFI